ncbi:uncharacterized protein EI90DRAFT_2924166 [Cantharellus anzutake]|uniref:uncharacterized protein n=1 Tax=Cantharellus anzutake TaxID=1750568 RepID=UPI0019073D2A|nr:uncharacterized protein EI90DRAFT_2924166 [Cantharellus anzutake]KAF8329385.1 hypothetical protein EI90DRAFT_2924166 [Cantharellus anzutake]
MSSKLTAKERGRCVLAEILQYECSLENKKSALVCYPIPRVFRMCPGEPAVEMSSFLSLDNQTGSVVIPEHVDKIIPKARPWRDIRKLRGEYRDSPVSQQ